MKLCRIATVPFVFIYNLRGQITATIKEGHEVYLVSSAGPSLETVGQENGAHLFPISIHRSISLWNDLKALLDLARYFRKMKFDLVHSVTQKAGLLTALAGFMTRVPVRLHTFTGQPWMHKRGWVRWASKFCDWLMLKLNTRCYADSQSQSDYLVQQGIANKGEIEILGPGSLAGVDLNKFNREMWVSARGQIRRGWNVPDGACVINFTGRINLEKGIRELIDAFECLDIEQKEIFLLLVGPFEVNREPIPPELMQRIQKNPHIRVVGESSQPEKFFAISDIFCLPSYREGFGIVALEAAAMGLPTVGTRVVGLVDAIIDGKTGILVPPKDSQALHKALSRLLADNQCLKKMGQNAMNHAKSFDSRYINRLVLGEYDKLFALR